MTSLEERLAKLERLVEAQQATIEAKDREIERLQVLVLLLGQAVVQPHAFPPSW